MRGQAWDPLFSNNENGFLARIQRISAYARGSDPYQRLSQSAGVGGQVTLSPGFHLGLGGRTVTISTPVLNHRYSVNRGNPHAPTQLGGCQFSTRASSLDI